MYRRFSFFPAVVSILCGILVFFLFSLNVPPYSGELFGESYAVLAFDESQDDRRVRETLTLGGLTGLISESSQEIPIDDFGFPRMIPLDMFRDKIEPFDPRDTGYAEKLRAFFVHGGQRFFFLPLDGATGGDPASLNARIAILLPETPFTLTILGQRRSFFHYFALLALACAFALFFSRSRRFFAIGLPVLLSFGWSGSFGFILAAILAAIWESLREPLEEITAARHYQRPGYHGFGFSGFLERLKPFKTNCALVLFFVISYVIFSAMAGISLFPFAAAFTSLCLLYFLTFRIEARHAKKNRHVLFTPVPLFPFRRKTFSLFPLLSPFGVAAMLSMFLPLFLTDISPFGRGENEFPVNIHYIVRAGDYYQHIEFQRSFSFRPLDWGRAGESGAGYEALIQEAYPRYYLGEDGLIAGSASHAVNFWTAPPFPLEKLTLFLLNYSEVRSYKFANQRFGTSTTSFLATKEWFLVAMIFTAKALDFFQLAKRPWSRNKKFKEILLSRDRRMAA